MKRTLLCICLLLSITLASWAQGTEIHGNDSCKIIGTTLLKWVGNAANPTPNLTLHPILKDITIIGEKAFENDSIITSITLPVGVKEIKKEAFKGAKKLTKIDNFQLLSSLITIETEAFADCKLLTTLSLPNIVYKIDERAFAGCDLLASIIVPATHPNFSSQTAGTLFSKDNQRLLWYSNQKKDKSFIIPLNTNVLDKKVFSENQHISNLIVDPNNKSFKSEEGVLFSKDGKDLLLYPLKKDNSQYIIPQNVKNIVESAFENNKIVTSVAIPSTVAIIGNNAFKGCTNLKNITIHTAGVPSMGSDVFKDVPSSLIVTVPKESKTQFQANPHWNIYTLDELKTFEISTDGKTLLKWHDENITKIDMNNDNDLKEIKIIGQEVFKGKKNLAEIILPEGLKKIEKFAFEGCTALKTIKIPQEVNEVEAYAFRNCPNLEKIEVEDNNIYFKSVNGVLFSNNGKILVRFPSKHLVKDYRLPFDVEKIGHGAFEDCPSIVTVTMAEVVKEIGSFAFKGCSGLKRVNITTKVPPSLGHKVFDGAVKPGDSLVVLRGYVTPYKAANQWNSFMIYEIGTVTSNEVIPSIEATTLYPNPVIQTVQVKSSSAMQTITVYTLAGEQLLKQHVAGATQVELDLSSLSTGLYILTVEDVNKAVQTFKVIKK